MMHLLRLLLLLIFFYTSCSTTGNDPNLNVWYDSTAYPKRPFQSVSLIVLDSTARLKTFSGGMTIWDTSVVKYIGRGFSFMDSSGHIKTTQYKKYDLDSSQILQLQSFLKEYPCPEGPIPDKTCMPTFHYIFVFYDNNKIPLAQVHTCFHCEMSGFMPYSDSMCNFDNTVDYAAFKKFTREIVERK